MYASLDHDELNNVDYRCRLSSGSCAADYREVSGFDLYIASGSAPLRTRSPSATPPSAPPSTPPGTWADGRECGTATHISGEIVCLLETSPCGGDPDGWCAAQCSEAQSCRYATLKVGTGLDHPHRCWPSTAACFTDNVPADGQQSQQGGEGGHTRVYIRAGSEPLMFGDTRPLEPTTSDSTTSEPTTSEPTTPAPTTPAPATSVDPVVDTPAPVTSDVSGQPGGAPAASTTTTPVPAAADGTSAGDTSDASTSSDLLMIIIALGAVLAVCVLLGARSWKRSNGPTDNELEQWNERQRAGSVNVPNPVYKTHAPGAATVAPGFGEYASTDGGSPPLVYYSDPHYQDDPLAEYTDADAYKAPQGDWPGAVYAMPAGGKPAVAVAAYGSLGPATGAGPPGGNTYDSLDHRPVTVYMTGNDDDPAAQYSVSQASSEAVVYAAPPGGGKGNAISPTDYYAVPGGGGSQPGAGGVNFHLLPEQASTAAPLKVTMVDSGANSLFVHQLDRAGAEAMLTAAAVADTTVVRYLIRPKGGQTVLSILIPVQSKFYHDRVVRQPNGQFAVHGCKSSSVVGVAGKVAEALAKSAGASGSEPVLRGIDRAETMPA